MSKKRNKKSLAEKIHDALKYRPYFQAHPDESKDRAICIEIINRVLEENNINQGGKDV